MTTLTRLLCVSLSVALGFSTIGVAQTMHKGKKSIVIDREVLLSGVKGTANAITRTSDGNLVIAGVRGVGWAVGTSADGVPQWNYEESVDPNVKTQYQSAFEGVVALNDGRILLCGEHRTAEYQSALIVILDKAGKLIERRSVFPNNDRRVFGSSLSRCMHWGDEVVLTGDGTDGKEGLFWLMKLDKNGAKLWEKYGREVPGINGLITSDNNLVLMGNDKGTEGSVTVTRINSQGEREAETKTGFLEAQAVRMGFAANVSKLVGVDARNNGILLTLDNSLKKVSDSKLVNAPSIRDGCAYLFSDGSVALFGNRFLEGSIYRASAAWIDEKGNINDVHDFSVPESSDVSFAVRDAVLLSTNRFVTLREQISGSKTSDTGVILNWLTFQ